MPNQSNRRNQQGHSEKIAAVTDGKASEGRHTSPKETHATKHRRWNTFLQTGLLVVGVVYSFFACQQWLAIRSQVEEARKATEFQTRALHIDQRAWIGATSVEGAPAAGFNLDGLVVRYKNFGKTMAKNCRFLGVCERVRRGDNPSFSVEDNPKTISTGQSVGLALPGEEERGQFGSRGGYVITEEDYRSFTSGDTTLYVHGRITYDDIFGCSHWTTFSMRLVPDLRWEDDRARNDVDNNECP